LTPRSLFAPGIARVVRQSFLPEHELNSANERTSMLRLLLFIGTGCVTVALLIALGFDLVALNLRQRVVTSESRVGKVEISLPPPNEFDLSIPPGRTYKQVFTQKLKPGTLAPPLRLERADGTGEEFLENHLGDKPIVLLFGSFS
jgi:hypothetical protein